MTIGVRRSAVIAALLGATLLGGCTQFRAHQGFIVDEALVASVQPGIDNRDSVLGTLGRPTFVGQFDQRDWYYVSRNTKNLGFAMPKPSEQTVLHVRFDETGNVASVERSGLEQIASINPMNDETPTLGQKRGFFEELFGNIGSVGAPGQQAGTADNPN